MSKIPMFPNKFAILASILGGKISGGKMADIRGSKTNIEVAKDCFASLSDYSWGIWICSSAVEANCYIYVYREASTVGLIDITEVSTGQTQRYKRGYTDSDFVLVC